MRRVHDWRAEQRAVDPAVADRERAAGEFLERQLVRLRALREFADPGLDFGETHALGVPQDRHDETLAAADRDADVVVVAVDDRVAAQFGIHARDQLQRFDRGLHEERHEAELRAVLLEEGVLVLVAQRHDRGHVDLVERREQRGVGLRFDESLGDPTAQRRHRDDLFFARAAGRLRGGRSRCGRFRRAGRALHVFLEHASARTRRRHGRGVDASGRECARGGGHDHGFASGRRGLRRDRSGFDRLGRRLRRGRLPIALRRRGRLRARRRGTGFHVTDDLTDQGLFALLLEDLRHLARDGRGQLDRHFVGLDDDERGILTRARSFADQPVADLHFGDRFADGGDLEFGDGHAAFLRVRDHARPKARSRTSCCSILWLVGEPVAGDAAAARVDALNGRPAILPPKRTRRWCHAPMFAGSSCTQITGTSLP